MRRVDGADWYAVVLVEDFAVTGVLMFPTERLSLSGPL